MKRIKRILCSVLIIVSVLFLAGCKKDYSSITYKRFVEKMSDELNYSVTDSTLDYEDVYQRYYSAIKDDVVINYIEFESEEKAKEYMKTNYYKQKYYSYKDNDDYSTAKYTKIGYLYVIQVDNMVIKGSTDKNTKTSVVKKVFKELGY